MWLFSPLRLLWAFYLHLPPLPFSCVSHLVLWEQFYDTSIYLLNYCAASKCPRYDPCWKHKCQDRHWKQILPWSLWIHFSGSVRQWSSPFKRKRIYFWNQVMISRRLMWKSAEILDFGTGWSHQLLVYSGLEIPTWEASIFSPIAREFFIGTFFKPDPWHLSGLNPVLLQPAVPYYGLFFSLLERYAHCSYLWYVDTADPPPP